MILRGELGNVVGPVRQLGFNDTALFAAAQFKRESEVRSRFFLKLTLHIRSIRLAPSAERMPSCDSGFKIDELIPLPTPRDRLW